MCIVVNILCTWSLCCLIIGASLYCVVQHDLYSGQVVVVSYESSVLIYSLQTKHLRVCDTFWDRGWFQVFVQVCWF